MVVSKRSASDQRFTVIMAVTLADGTPISSIKLGYRNPSATEIILSSVTDSHSIPVCPTVYLTRYLKGKDGS